MNFIGGRNAARGARMVTLAALIGLAAGCSKDMAAKEDTAPRSGPSHKYDPKYDESVFGKRGVSIGSIRSNRPGGILGGGEAEGGNLPVNKYIWQASLDTLSFLPLASTDPFTGVIATDWGATPEAPGERFKVTAYVVSPALSAASLKVAVYREVRDGNLWVPAEVNPDTALQLENAILTRARQLRIAEATG
ncbi:MAG TPA: DUF3576 domain-containing protein [Thermohalobaculum sp.]|nr:DUF3576 domain-containing protein [Thermohalobaculum sp.]